MLKLIGGILVAGSGVGLAVNMIAEAYFESTDADERCGVAKSMRTDC